MGHFCYRTQDLLPEPGPIRFLRVRGDSPDKINQFAYSLDGARTRSNALDRPLDVLFKPLAKCTMYADFFARRVSLQCVLPR